MSNSTKTAAEITVPASEEPLVSERIVVSHKEENGDTEQDQQTGKPESGIHFGKRNGSEQNEASSKTEPNGDEGLNETGSNAERATHGEGTGDSQPDATESGSQGQTIKEEEPLESEERNEEGEGEGDDAQEESSIEDILALGQGLDENDYKAELDVLQNDPTSPLYSAATFEELGLSPQLLQGVYGMKFSKPSRIQSVALPMIVQEPPQNLIGQAQSGSGKTATFVLGMLHRVDAQRRVPQALCVGPTRELVRQIEGVVRIMGKYTGAEAFLAIPGNDLPRGETVMAQIVVGTPGKVESMVKRRMIPTKDIKILVLDEADVMVEEGGMRDRSMSIKRLVQKGNPNCQILLFSATYAEDVRSFAMRVVPNHNIITVKKEQLTLDGIKQVWIDCVGEEARFKVLTDIYSLIDVGKSVIFVQTRETCKWLTRRMREAGYSVGILHGADMEKETRDKVIDEFRRGTTKVLVTTNVLARGIDVLGVSLVINYDIPYTRERTPDYETYLHRIGRTGRFGRKGAAVNLVHNADSKRALASIESYYQREIVQIPADDLEALEKMLHA